MATQATSLGESLSTVSFLELRELSCKTDVPCTYRNLPKAIKTRPIKQLTLSDPPYISSTTTTTSSPITTSSSGAQRDTQQPESGLNSLSKIVIGATVGSFSLILIIILTIWLLQRRRKGKRQKPVLETQEEPSQSTNGTNILNLSKLEQPDAKITELEQPKHVVELCEEGHDRVELLGMHLDAEPPR